ncbi:MAG: L,D-transpeptidase catalytic domain [Deltaproteobacteria bacterium ADurb.Bin207]|jgi:hypothetical protein|nr:MAG: L,D-transpeptidase catalytic domain [Deltaproteobacteria bacterium ADurb.Bin207]
MTLPAASWLLSVSVATAQSPPPWIDPGDVPIPVHANSVLAIHDEVPVFESPEASAKRRGVLAADIPLPFFAFRRGPGCAGRWIGIGPSAWVCQDKITLSHSQPVPASFSTYRESKNGLPYPYFFVGRRGSWGYVHLRSVDVSMPDQNYEPGFAVAIVQEREHNRELYGRTTRGYWVPMRDLNPARPTTFHGEVVRDGLLDFVWIHSAQARALSKPMAHAAKQDNLVRFQWLRVEEEKIVAGHAYYRIGENRWVSDRDARKPSLAPPPDEIRPGERWIDIHLDSQTLVAYEGDRPVYATLVSTGRGRQNTPFATPFGVHRIWVKLLTSSMGNLQDERASDLYLIEDVPFVQFFHKGVGLHAAFWHDRFGNVRSHGCVNLAPYDAQWLFAFTSPRLPAGWRAILPHEHSESTIVRVR